MSQVSASCPACGSPLVFTVATSLVTVCRACDSVVARGDQALEDLGKVARLTETGAQLEVGQSGRYEGTSFMLTGRTQLAHEAGGVWDEWYAAFDDGRWGWLAEAQGKYYLTFEVPLEGRVPPLAELRLGSGVAALQRGLVVSEKGHAKAISAEGELPFTLVPGAGHPYADLSSAGLAFATLDYSAEQPRFFLGKRVTLDDLGIAVARRAEPKRRVSATQVSCPQCGAQLALRAPDEAQRVVCPSCDALLDATEGALRYLQTLKQPKAAPKLPLGAKGTALGVELRVVGYLVKSVTYEGTRYPWEEYLLHSDREGFRWLVCADGHWSFGEPVSAASVTLGPYGRTARLDGVVFRRFQEGTPRVDAVYGELYWKVSAGESAASVDFIAPPFMLSSEEASYASGGSEINWTKLTYVEPEAVARAFEVKGLPKPEGVAPNQVFAHKGVFKTWRRAMAASFVLFLFFALSAKDRVVFERTLGFDALASTEGTQVFFTEPFELSRGTIEVSLAAPDLQNAWVYVQGDFVNEDSGLVQEFDLPIEAYSGVDEGEAWSEGSRSASTTLSPLPKGRYSLRLEAQWGQWQLPITLQVRVKEDVVSISPFAILLLLLSIVPVLVAIANYNFDVRRWRDSDFSPYG